GDTAADAGVLARPFEGGGAAGLAGIVNIYAIELVLQAAIAAGRRQLAGIIYRGNLEGAGREHARGGRDQRAPAGDVGVGGRARGRADIAVEHAHLPDRLEARGRVDADRALDEIGLLEMRDLPIPHIE